MGLSKTFFWGGVPVVFDDDVMSAEGWVLHNTFLDIFVISLSWRILCEFSCVAVKIVIATLYPRVDYVDLLKATGLTEEVYKGRVTYILHSR